MQQTLSAIDYQFEYFDLALGPRDWEHATVLDFGGNQGGFLRDPLCSVPHENYWAVDVSRAATDAGAKRFANAHFLHYDRFHALYNPGGTRDASIPPRRKFDVIVAYSVMTHLLPADMVAIVDELRAKLARGGVLAFTFEDATYCPVEEPKVSNFADSLRHARRLGLEPKVTTPAGAWCVLADDELFVETEEIVGRGAQFLDVFYTPGAMKRFVPDAEIVAPPLYRQHCAICRAER